MKNSIKCVYLVMNGKRGGDLIVYFNRLVLNKYKETMADAVKIIRLYNK